MNSNKSKKNMKTVLLVLLAIAMFIVAGVFSYNRSKSKAIESSKKAFWSNSEENKKNSTDDREGLSVKSVDGIKNILLLGADYRKGDKTARSDSMMVVTIDTVHNKVKLTSLLRDMLVNIPGYGKSKLNHAFAFGGVELLKETIQNNFGLSIDNYAVIDFDGFVDVIDELGGVEVDVKQQVLHDFNIYVKEGNREGAKEINKPGKYNLTGAQALAYARIRYTSGGEQGRTSRQREIINSTINKFKDTSLLKYPSLIKKGLKYVDTDLSLTDILNLIYTANKMDLSHIQTLYIPFEEISKPGIWKNHGWVFRIDLDVTGKLLREYLFDDKKVDLSNINKADLNYNE